MAPHIDPAQPTSLPDFTFNMSMLTADTASHHNSMPRLAAAWQAVPAAPSSPVYVALSPPAPGTPRALYQAYIAPAGLGWQGGLGAHQQGSGHREAAAAAASPLAMQAEGAPAHGLPWHHAARQAPQRPRQGPMHHRQASWEAQREPGHGGTALTPPPPPPASRSHGSDDSGPQARPAWFLTHVLSTCHAACHTVLARAPLCTASSATPAAG